MCTLYGNTYRAKQDAVTALINKLSEPTSASKPMAVIISDVEKDHPILCQGWGDEVKKICNQLILEEKKGVERITSGLTK